MAVVVIGCGRSGTNVVLEILRGSDAFLASSEPQDREVFQTNIPGNYLTKYDLVYDDYNMISHAMKRNKNLNLIWTWRDPRDMCLSKMKRGVPVEEGGDCKHYSSDGTPEGCVDNIKLGYKIYRELCNVYSDRIITVRMEDILTDIKKETKRLCAFLDVEYNDNMIQFWTRMRNKHKADRYKSLDKSQIGLWKHWDDVYGGWFAGKDDMILNVFGGVESIKNNLGYV